jgi:hypothetical protein
VGNVIKDSKIQHTKKVRGMGILTHYFALVLDFNVLNGIWPSLLSIIQSFVCIARDLGQVTDICIARARDFQSQFAWKADCEFQ